MFKRILVANRGAVASRILRTCRELGVEGVAVYSEADRAGGHLALADEAHWLGPAPAAQSYLNGPRLLEVAQASGCEAVHPGYGFLSESADFAQACEAAGLAFIGPRPQTLRLLGDKVECLRAAQSLGIPCLPGSTGALESQAALEALAQTQGLPLMLKAAHGGGGLGSRVLRDPADLPGALEDVRGLALKLFGDATVFAERYVSHARHLEVQVLGDGEGRAVHLFDRECTLQRRHQKVIEEGPSVHVPEDVRAQLWRWAVQLTQAVRLRGVATVEFLYDGQGCHFLEVNPRLQVEHGVTEMLTGVDLVREQLRIAAGEPLAYAQEALHLHGYAVEARIYAEDPATQLPAPGTVDAVRWPHGTGLRVDTFLEAGTRVSAEYDPLLAKVIAHADTKEAAARRLALALRQCVVNGTARTNLPLLVQVLEDPRFLRGEYHTRFLDQDFSLAPPSDQALRLVAQAAQAVRLSTRKERRQAPSPGGVRSGWAGPGWRQLP